MPVVGPRVRALLAPAMLLLLLLLLLALATSAQGSVAAQDSNLQYRARQALMRFDQHDAPGCAVGAFRDGRAIFKHAFGLADLQSRSHIETRAAFGVASVSKQFTAALAAIAAHEGHLSLQDDVRKYVPELPDYGTPITIEQLIHHTSGLRDDWTLIRISGHDLERRDDIVRLIARQRALNFAPGTRFLYSNAGYVLLAEVIERATRQNLREYARRKIFEPLGMRASYYRDRPSSDQRLVTAYVQHSDGWREKDMPETAARIGTQGVVTTLDDYAKWATNLFAERSRLPGGTALTRRLLTPGQLTDGSQAPYAFGLRPQRYRGVQAWNHAGSGWGFKAEAMMFPEQGLTVAAFCNNGRYAAPVVLAVVDLLLPAVAQPQVVPPTLSVAAADLAPFAGTYREPSLGLPMIVADGAGELRVSGDAVDMRFQPVSSTTFRAEGNAEIEFELQPQKPASRLYQRGVTTYGTGSFDRIEAARPRRDQLAVYVGKYFSAELQTTYQVEINGDVLTARVPDADTDLAVTYTFTPTIVDEFADLTEALVLRFERDAERKVRQFVLNAQFGRVQGIVFERLPEQAAADAAVTRWVRERAVPFESITGGEYQTALKATVGDARVVSFGEANHNAHEFLMLRNRLFSYLVEELGFTAFAAETDYVRGIDVDRYVTGEVEGSQAHANAVLSWTQATFAENQALIGWMREYNDRPSTKRKVRFYGLEAAGNLDQDGRHVLSYALDYVDKVDEGVADGLQRRISAWHQSLTQPKYAKLSAQRRDAAAADIADLVALFEQWHVHWIARSSALEYQRAYRAAIAARQLSASLRLGGGGRDMASFDNLRWALEREGAAGRIFVFMHNMHVTRWRKFAPPQHPLHSSLGEHANELLGRQMVVIGSSHYAGVTRNWLDLQGFDNCRRSLLPARNDSFDAALARAKLPGFFLKLAEAPPSVGEWLNREQPVRNINILPGYSTLRPGVAFDAVFYVHDIQPLTALHDDAEPCIGPPQ